MLGPSPAQALDPTHDKILYMVADAHLDDEWNWTIQDTINSYIPATLHANFALLAAYPHYIFNWEESWRYQLVQEYYPADFVTLTNYIAQGRWRQGSDDGMATTNSVDTDTFSVSSKRNSVGRWRAGRRFGPGVRSGCWRMRPNLLPQ